jgi:hypothetical protein
MAKRWNSYATPELELGPGILVKYYEGDEVFVVNGLYLEARERFFPAEGGKGKETVRFYVVSWDEKTLPWKDFNDKLIGAPNPPEALPGSLRHNVLMNWRGLGLKEAPTLLDNAFMASGSPLEALAERCNWIGMRIENDLYGRALMLANCSVPVVRDWLTNPVISIGLDTGLAYDLVRGKQASEILNLLSDATDNAMFTSPSRGNKKDKDGGKNGSIAALIGKTPKRKLFKDAVADKFLNSKTEEDLKDFFSIYDAKGTGFIADREDFKRDFVAMDDFGFPAPPKAVERLFSQHDRLKDGRMDFEEFCIIVMARLRL